MKTRINTKVVYQMTDDPDLYIELERSSYVHSGLVADCKGGNSKAEEQLANQQQASQNALMQQQLQMQQKQINMANPTLQSIISAGGMLPAQEAAMRASYLNQLPSTLQQGMGQINQSLVARGLTGGPSGAGGGAVAGNYGALMAALGSMQQQGETSLQMAKAQGLNQALNTTLGVGSMYGQNVGTFNQGANSALNSGVTAANNADQAETSWMGPVFGALGSAAGGWANGGFKTPCWIARELYGSWGDPRTIFIRSRLDARARKQLTFAVLVVIYRAIGEAAAKLVRTNKSARRIAARVFDKFLRDEMDYVLNEAVHAI